MNLEEEVRRLCEFLKLIRPDGTVHHLDGSRLVIRYDPNYKNVESTLILDFNNKIAKVYSYIDAGGGKEYGREFNTVDWEKALEIARKELRRKARIEMLCREEAAARKAREVAEEQRLNQLLENMVKNEI